MRKRSEIGKPKQEEQSKQPDPSPSLMGKVTCTDCGLEQPRGTSDCLGCGATLPAGSVGVVPAGATAPKRVEQPMENLGKLAYDLKSKDVDVTLAQICATPPEDRRALQAWVDAKSPDVPPAVRMILERLNPKPPPLISGAKEPNDQIFKNYQPTPEEARGKTVGVDMASGPDRTVQWHGSSGVVAVQDVGEEVTFVYGKEMYRVTEFCTFDVGPFSATTKIRSGETRIDALLRLRAELEAAAEVERAKKRDGYIQTLLGIKPALQAASKAKE